LGLVGSTEHLGTNNTPDSVRLQAKQQIKDIDLSKYTEEEQEQILELYNMIKHANNPSHKDMLQSHVSMTDTYRTCDTWNTIGWNYEQI
jgi:propanediol dehydratase small subunit